MAGLWQIPNLDRLLSRGVCPPNPSTLLGSHNMREILNNLRARFDFILLDSPPVVAISDATVTSVNCDGVLLVLHAQKTRAALARQAIERLDTVRAALLGVVLNGIDYTNPDYAYYRSYYGSYYGVMNEGPATTDKPVIETVSPEVSQGELWKPQVGAGTVPQEFLDSLVAKLTEAAGPMASVIVREKVADLGESLGAFPKNRLKELFNKLCEEILDENLRQGFQNVMSEKIRLLDG